MKEQILEIAEKLRLELITEYEAQDLLLGLFGVSNSVCHQCGSDKSKEVRKCDECGIPYYRN
jgi:hypothetical protein